MEALPLLYHAPSEPPLYWPTTYLCISLAIHTFQLDLQGKRQKGAREKEGSLLLKERDASLIKDKMAK